MASASTHARRRANGLRCAYCGVALVPSTAANWAGPLRDRIATTDHWIPLSRGGTDEAWNRFPCCHACNQAKGSRLLPLGVPVRPVPEEAPAWLPDLEPGPFAQHRHPHCHQKFGVGRVWFEIYDEAPDRWLVYSLSASPTGYPGGRLRLRAVFKAEAQARAWIAAVLAKARAGSVVGVQAGVAAQAEPQPGAEAAAAAEGGGAP